jgi:hypothetical protein
VPDPTITNRRPAEQTEDPWVLLAEWMEWWDEHGPAKMPHALHVRTAVALVITGHDVPGAPRIMGD